MYRLCRGAEGRERRPGHRSFRLSQRNIDTRSHGARGQPGRRGGCVATLCSFAWTFHSSALLTSVFSAWMPPRLSKALTLTPSDASTRFAFVRRRTAVRVACCPAHCFFRLAHAPSARSFLSRARRSVFDTSRLLTSASERCGRPALILLLPSLFFAFRPLVHSMSCRFATPCRAVVDLLSSPPPACHDVISLLLVDTALALLPLTQLARRLS